MEIKTLLLSMIALLSIVTATQLIRANDVCTKVDQPCSCHNHIQKKSHDHAQKKGRCFGYKRGFYCHCDASITDNSSKE